MHKLLTHLVRVGKILAPVFERGVVQQMQVQTSPWEIRDSVNSLQMYGFASSPLPGADVVIVNLAGDNSNGQVIASNDQRYRPQGMLGGEAMVHDNTGQYLHLKAGTDIVLVANKHVSITAAADVTINAPMTYVSGSLVVGTGATGTFTAKSGQIVTVKDGIVVNIF